MNPSLSWEFDKATILWEDLSTGFLRLVAFHGDAP